MIAVTVFCVLAGVYIESQKKIVNEREAWLTARNNVEFGPGIISLHRPKVLSLGSKERGPSFVRQWLGDVPQDEIKLWSITDDEKRRAVELFPEARVLDLD